MNSGAFQSVPTESQRCDLRWTGDRENPIFLWIKHDFSYALSCKCTRMKSLVQIQYRAPFFARGTRAKNAHRSPVQEGGTKKGTVPAEGASTRAANGTPFFVRGAAGETEGCPRGSFPVDRRGCRTKKLRWSSLMKKTSGVSLDVASSGCRGALSKPHRSVVRE